jgi:hypothetical protein
MLLREAGRVPVLKADRSGFESQLCHSLWANYLTTHSLPSFIYFLIFILFICAYSV